MNDDIKLITDYDKDIGFYYFVVQQGDQILHFRPGFHTHEEAQESGDVWIREQLGGKPLT